VIIKSQRGEVTFSAVLGTFQKACMIAKYKCMLHLLESHQPHDSVRAFYFPKEMERCFAFYNSYNQQIGTLIEVHLLTSREVYNSSSDLWSRNHPAKAMTSYP
jgi:hypothetical protein